MPAHEPTDASSDLPTPAGLELAPFRALRYALDGAELAAATSPPYDVIDDEERAALARRSSQNVVELILPEDEPNQPGSRYDRAAQTLHEWRRSGLLRRDAEPALYVYEETIDGHVQRGLVGAVGLARPDAGIILPHEDTMAGPVADRLALTSTTHANLEPIFLVYEGGGDTARLIAGVDTEAPLLDTVTDDGVRHRIWAITDTDALDTIRRDLLPRRATIADGHHRFATYLRYQAQRHEAGDGRGPWDAGLAFVVDITTFGPQVHAIHRVVPSLPLAEAVERAGRAFRVEEVDDRGEALLDRLAKAGRDGPAFALANATTAVLLTAPDPAALERALPADRSPAWRGLDVAVAHHLLIRAVWGLDDREDVVGFRHDLPATMAAVGNSGTALLLNPTPVEAVAAVAAAGERMPRKSTLFTPKPRTGLLMRLLDEG